MKTIKRTLLYLVGWVHGLIIAVFSDVTITTLAVTGILAGSFAKDALFGFLVFFALYSVARISQAIANAIGTGLLNIARVHAAQNSNRRDDGAPGA